MPQETYGLIERDDGKWICPRCDLPPLRRPAKHGCNPTQFAAEVAEAAAELGLDQSRPATWSHYRAALARWRLVGYPTRTAEEIAQLYRTYCNPEGRPCEYFRTGQPPLAQNALTGLALRATKAVVRLLGSEEPGQCSLCGCQVSTNAIPLVNKLAMATEGCPAGKFSALRSEQHTGGTLRMTTTKVYVLGYPGDVGGANTECWHTIKLWRRFGVDVHLIPHLGMRRPLARATRRVGMHHASGRAQ